ncbi:MAG: TonB-dependent receptor, partial [Caulobacteraceae bacterium]
DGVHSYQDRDWYKGWGTIPDATGKLLIRPNIVSRNVTVDGMFIAAGSALNGLAFRRDGSTYNFVTSDTSSGALGTPAARQSITNGGSGDDIGAGERNTIYPNLTRKNFYSYADYQLTNNLTIFAQYMHGETTDFAYGNKGGLFGQATAVTIFRDNAYLPDSIRQTMVAENRQSITFKRQGSILDIGVDGSVSDKSVLNSITTGFNWKIDRQGLFSGWAVDGYYQYGHNAHRAAQVGLRVDRIFAAIDAVKDPATGKIVCRTSLFNNQFAGCQPLNLFGRGNASPAAVDWVNGFEPGQQITTPIYFADSGYSLGQTDSYTSEEAKVANATVQQHVAELSANGEVFKGWGAGPITAAVGGSYRRESIRQIVRDPSNPPDDNDRGHPVLCNTDAAAIAAGLRGVNQADCTNTVGIQQSKVSNILGTISTKEAFAEAQIPLIANAPLMQSIRANVAARWADYSGSGTIWAYKGGLDWQLNDMLRLRGTYSRDVRAANLSERYDKTGGFVNVVDPRFPADGSVSITRFSGGNPNVVPEKADTITAGAVVQPGFLPGFSISADWYRIKINGAIGQLGAQNVVNQCEAGAQDICKLVTRDATTGRLVLVGDVFVNINESLVSGVDMEASYRRSIDIFGGGETISARMFGSWLNSFSEKLTGAPTINRAGQTGIQQSNGVGYSLPKFKASGNITYTRGPLTIFVQGRYTAKGTFENALVVGKDIESNTVPAVFYTDLRLAYRFPVRGTQMEVFGTVTNVFDKDPPITPYWGNAGSTVTQTNPNVYDTLGRRFVLGAKVAF